MTVIKAGFELRPVLKPIHFPLHNTINKCAISYWSHIRHSISALIVLSHLILPTAL